MTTLYDDLSRRPEWSCPACREKDAEIKRLREALAALLGELPGCSCIDAYKDRGLIDVQCPLCNWFEDDTIDAAKAALNGSAIFGS